MGVIPVRMKRIFIQLLSHLIKGFEEGAETPVPLSLFGHRLNMAFLSTLTNPTKQDSRTTAVQPRWLGLIPQGISSKTMTSNGLYGIERPGGLFNYCISVIMKSESVADGNRYVQFAHAFNARYRTRTGKLSFRTWVMNDHFITCTNWSEPPICIKFCTGKLRRVSSLVPQATKSWDVFL